MKQILLSILIFLCLIPIRAFSQDCIVIKGKVVNPKSNSITVSFPINNISSWAFTEKIILDKDGNFHFSHETSHCGFYSVWHEIAPSNNLTAKLFLSPGYTCYLILNSENYVININCNRNNEANILYNSLIRKQLDLQRNGEIKFKNYTPQSISDTIMACRASQFNEVLHLYENRLMDHEFYDLISSDISLFYGALYYDLIGYNVFMSQLPDNHSQHISMSNELLHFADSTLYQLFLPFEKNPSAYIESKNASTISQDFTQTGLIHSPEYLNALEKYIHYKGYYIPQRNNSFEIDKVNKDLHGYNLSLYAQYLKNEEFEYSVGNYFYFWFQKIQLAEGLIKPYASFKSYYPSNPFISYIDSVAGLYEEFNAISTSEFPENIRFISHSDSINDLNTLLKEFKGQTLYIDIWATTCPPCIKEFEYYEQLYPFFSINNIQLLYISLDKPSNKEHWKKTIKKYDLIGYHILANEKLKEDIKKITNMIGIPWYCIKNNDDSLSKDFIYRPSSKEELIKQVSRYISD